VKKAARIEQTLADVQAELTSAMAAHGPMRSRHEAYAVILEEVDEFWEEVKLKESSLSKLSMKEALTQIAAMACRTIVDLEL
jgi:hypothetical protein